MTAPWAEDADDRWSDRLRTIATFIPPRQRVIDLGAGSGALRRYLKRGCTYTAADVRPRTPDTLPFDMNRGIWPEGEWDCAVLSGVLEYADDPADVMSHVTQLAPLLVLSYDHGGSLAYRRNRQWRNHLSRAGLEQIIEAAYRRSRAIYKWRGQVIYRAMR